MLKAKEIATVAGTLGCAVGIGFVMQGGNVSGGWHDHVLSQGQDADTFLEVERITLTSAQTDSPAIVLPREDRVQLASIAMSTLELPEQEVEIPSISCDITAVGTAVEAAMIELDLNAPCLPNERVTVHHHGMMFTQSTDADGKLHASIPALDESAIVVFAFSSGDGTMTELNVPDLAGYSRTVVQWRGDAGFEMHAREFGASYGEQGHVWKDAARSSDAVKNGQGFLTRLGNPAISGSQLAEIYTFPKAKTERSGIIDLSIEAKVTALNCGLEVEAQSLEVIDGDVKLNNLNLVVPGCGAKGNFLVLNNLVKNLKVASN